MEIKQYLSGTLDLQGQNFIIMQISIHVFAVHIKNQGQSTVDFLGQ